MAVVAVMMRLMMIMTMGDSYRAVISEWSWERRFHCEPRNEKSHGDAGPHEASDLTILSYG